MYIYHHPVHSISDSAKQNVYYIMSTLKSALPYTVLMYMIFLLVKMYCFVKHLYLIFIFLNYL